MILRALASSLLCLATFAPTLGCGCTEIGCVAATSLDLEAESWPAGEYTIAVTVSRGTFTCVTKHSDESPGACLDPELNVSIGTGASATRVDLWGSVHEQVDLRIERDGAAVLDRTVETERDTFRPNGAFCDPECETAYAKVDL